MVGARTREATSAVLRGLQVLALAVVALVVCTGTPSRGREISTALEGLAWVASAHAQSQDAAVVPSRDAPDGAPALKAVEFDDDDDDDTRFDDEASFGEASDLAVVTLRAAPARDARCEAHVDTSRFEAGVAQARAPPV